MALSKDDYLKKYLSKDDMKKSSTTSKLKLKSKKKVKPKIVSGMKIVDADEDFPASIEQTSSRIADAPVEIVNVEDGEEEDEPIVVLVNNPVDELKMIGKFKSSNWNDVDPDEKSPKIKREINSPSPSHSNSQNIDRSIKIEPSDQSERRRHDSSDSDLSVRRSRPDRVEKSRRHDSSDSDQSLERNPTIRDRNSPDSDQSVKRRPIKKEKDEEVDRSVEKRARKGENRRRYSSDSDQSVKRQRSDKHEAVSKNGQKIKAEPDDVETSRRRRRRHSSADSDISLPRNRDNKSKGDRSPLRTSLNEPIKRKAQYDKDRGRKKKRELTEEEKKRQEELKKKYEVWNKGVKQVKDRKEKLDEMAESIDKPLARYRDDKDLDEHLKSQLFEEDPMSEYMHKKAVEEHKLTGNTPKVSLKPKYKGQAPANRYGILPGYRWDGVDRSNGFEDKLLSQANVKKAQEEEYYAWSSGQYE